MRILIFSVYYRPDGGAAAPLFTMLSEALVQRGHIVTVVTTVPHYPSGQVATGYKGWSIRKTEENGVRVIRLPVPSVKWNSFLARFLQLVVYQILATLYSLRYDFDVFVAHNPGFGIWLPFSWLVAFRRKPAIFSVHDVYPDVGIKLGIFRGKFIIGLVTWLEKFCLEHAKVVRILSSSFTGRIQALGVPEGKIKIVHDWVSIDNTNLVPRFNSFSTEYSLNETFNVVYAGNMGPVQGLDTVLEAAALINKEARIRFVLVGDGAAKPALMEKARQKGLSNVLFVPYQSREKMPGIWATADAALVVLRKGSGVDALPSKTFSIMASGRPLLVSVDEESETCKLVKLSDAGVWVPPEDPGKLAGSILTLKQDRALCERLGRNGRIWVEQHHSPQFAAEQFELMLNTALAKGNH
jgi:colanic acid biosynthesis glycosyl transferase WcaI